MAFYRVNLEAAITHIAEVESTERNAQPREILQGFPKLLEQGKQRGWIDKPNKVYHLSELVPLPVVIRRRASGLPSEPSTRDGTKTNNGPADMA